MLVDVFPRPDAKGMAPILEAIGRGKPPGAVRLEKGCYQISHFSFNHMICVPLDEFPTIEGLDNSYGVCDSPEQFFGLYRTILEGSGDQFCVSFTELCKADESPEGGWRWHKWGPYIGTQDPQMEYLYDEPVIERVFVYSVYKLL